jgi:hypothetical protein
MSLFNFHVLLLTLSVERYRGVPKEMEIRPSYIARKQSALYREKKGDDWKNPV